MKLTQQNYVEEAEKVIQDIREQSQNRDRRNRTKMITTSQIRKILAMVSDIYTQAKRSGGKTLSEDLKGQIQYLKLHIVYEAGRTPDSVGKFVEKSQLLRQLDDIGDSKQQLLLFCHYMEALVAYHRFYGGRD